VINPPGLIGARRLMTLFDRYDFKPSKARGQNFVIDPNTIRKVIAVSGVQRSDRVLEVGAGGGSLTIALAAACRWVYAIEYDIRLLPILHDVLNGAGNVDVVHGDALALDLSRFDAMHLVGNLPYNIATSVVLRALEDAPRIGNVTVMTQREVGERLAAAPGSRAYGLPSVMVQLYATARVAASVSRRAFYPVPNVDSVIVRISRREEATDIDHQRVHEVAKAAFAQRRKTLRNALAPLAGSSSDADGIIEKAGLDPGARPEDVAPEGFAALARLIR
jgi:16S rRNA (adenine1518-N6/adenine1519-N6)-dimethyltransferase